ncbi:MAG: hypothetical protein Q8O10_10665 [candidate division Zixibacteria bacterium]|nr:hypothetical protein [candidate division Zixibacteria bacterium]
MPSRKLVLGILLGILGLVITGCGMYVGGVFGGPRYGNYHHPRYCYDCHHNPGWGRAYDDCGFYDFYFAGNGYYYRPRHAGRRVYVYRKYNYGRDKEFVKYYERHRLNDKDRVRIEKEYRGVGEGERRRIEKEYREYDKKVESKKEHEEKSRR